MHDFIRVGILGGFGPLPTAHLYSRLSCTLEPRPDVIVLSPGISKDHERMLLVHDAHESTRRTLRDSLAHLRELTVDLATVPSVTVASILREYGMPASATPDWFVAMTRAVLVLNPRRLGIIATSAVLAHSELVQALRTTGIEIVSATHIQKQFHEWVLSCGVSGALVAPHDGLIASYSDFFQQSEVDACILACTEACLPGSSFDRVHSITINALSVLEELLISWISGTANNPLHHTVDRRADAPVNVW